MSMQENLAFSFFSPNWKIENTTEDHLGFDVDVSNGLHENKSWKVLDSIRFASPARLHNNKSHSTYSYVCIWVLWVAYIIYSLIHTTNDQ